MSEKGQIWFVYFIEAESGDLYCGITTGLKRRLKEHQEGKGAKFFRKSRACKIVYFERREGRSQALKREAQLKKLSKASKLALIDSQKK